MSDGLLLETWALRDVTDVEALCRGVLRELSTGLAQPLEQADREEALGFLLGETWIQHVKYLDKGYDRRPEYVFRAWLYQQLSSRLIDFWRTFYGRHGEKRVVDERLLSAERNDGDGDGDGAAAVDRPGASPDAGAADDDGLRAFPRSWTDAEGDRAAVRPVRGLGVGKGAGGPRRDRRAGHVARGRAARKAAGAGDGLVALDCADHGFEHLPAGAVVAWSYGRCCAACGAPLPAREAVAA